MFRLQNSVSLIILDKQGDMYAYTVAQVRFHEVSEAELELQRELFRTGRMQIKIEDIEFSMRYAHLPSAPALRCLLALAYICVSGNLLLSRLPLNRQLQTITDLYTYMKTLVSMILLACVRASMTRCSSVSVATVRQQAEQIGVTCHM